VAIPRGAIPVLSLTFFIAANAVHMLAPTD
jgi:hypothetical protein